MNREGRKPKKHPVDGREMTVCEIAKMLGIPKNALHCRRHRMNGASYQAIVNMYRANTWGSDKDRASRYLVEGRWMTRTQIAGMLGIAPHSLSAWRSQNRASMTEAVEHFRQWAESGRVHNPNGAGGKQAKKYRVGSRNYTIPGVARTYGVAVQTVREYVHAHGMAEALKHYQAAEVRKAEREIMKILGNWSETE